MNKPGEPPSDREILIGLLIGMRDLATILELQFVTGRSRDAAKMLQSKINGMLQRFPETGS